MHILANLRFGAKIAVAFALTALISLSTFVILHNRTTGLVQGIQNLGSNTLPSVAISLEIQNRFNEFDAQLIRHIIAVNDENQKEAQDLLNQASRDLDSLFPVYEQFITDAAERAFWATAREDWEKVKVASRPVLQLSNENRDQEALALTHGDYHRYHEELDAQSDSLVSLNLRLSKQEIQEGEVLFASVLRTFWIGMILLVASCVIFALLLHRGVTQPVHVVLNALSQVSQGDLRVRVNLKTNDEMGDLGRYLNDTLGQLEAFTHSIAEQSTTLSDSSESMESTAATMKNEATRLQEFAQNSSRLAGTANDSVAQAGRSVTAITDRSANIAAATGSITQNLNSVAASVEQMSANMTVVASASEHMNIGMNTVASAIEEMGASLSEVAGNSGQASKVANDAHQRAERSAATITRLDQSAQEIGKVVEMIKGIAAQTNLLALNATIEAASAGEAGKGFAVVAGEVKELAKQTAAATEDIRKQVHSIQEATHDSTEDMQAIVRVIQEVNTLNASIAAAVEQQTATTNEISRNVINVAGNVKEVSRNVQEAAAGSSEVSRNVQEAVHSVEEIARAIDELARQSQELSGYAENAIRSMDEVLTTSSQVEELSRQTLDGSVRTGEMAHSLVAMGQTMETSSRKFRTN